MNNEFNMQSYKIYYIRVRVLHKQVRTDLFYNGL